MNKRSSENGDSLWCSKFIWTLVIMMIVVAGLAVLSWRSPISKPIGERLITLTPTSGPTDMSLTPNPEPELIVLGPEDFLDPDEIGHTDGIILWGTVLMLILLLGTLRETILRKKKK